MANNDAVETDTRVGRLNLNVSTQNFIAGTFAGMAQTFTGHPFDTLKVPPSLSPDFILMSFWVPVNADWLADCSIALLMANL